MTCPPAPVILDFDGSVLPVRSDETRLDLRPWQDELRYICSWNTLKKLETFLNTSLPASYGPVFLGSGDFHHVSFVLLSLALARLEQDQMVDLIVCDNHPDNMRCPFGPHCGSWVCHAARLARVRHVHVLGIGSADLAWGQAWQNHLGPLKSGKLTYWSLGRPAGWLDVLGLKKSHQNFDQPNDLVKAFGAAWDRQVPAYLSIDKDVLSPEIIQTNWDQGRFELRNLLDIIDLTKNGLIGADICGEISPHVYKSAFKRLLTRLDGQKQPDPASLAKWQAEQQKINIELARALAGYRRETPPTKIGGNG